ncbi:MAG: tetratricopeptide repeat protein [Rariglobus sp.]
MKLLLLACVGLSGATALLASDHEPVAAVTAPVADVAPAAIASAHDAAAIPVESVVAQPSQATVALAPTHTTPAATPAVTLSPAVTLPATAPTADAHAPTHAETPAAIAAEINSLLNIGATKAEKRDWESAHLAYTQVLAAGRRASDEQIRDALLGLARVYRSDNRLTKACAIYERYIKDNPGDARLPVVYLELGRCLRALGAHRLATARFYSVLNSTLKLPGDGADSYRQLARTAQFEIAETYFQSGDYDQAWRFYSRLRLLDLAPVDRARAAFKSAYALNLKGDLEKSVTQLRGYLSLYPQNEDAPEARHLLSLALRRLGRTQESLAAALDLLKTEQAKTAADSKTWVYWQRRTGNQLANEFYEQGDITTALTIYQCLRDIGGPPDWLLPVHYQIGLCQERLNQTVLARNTYQGILDSLRSPLADNGKIAPALQDIASMVNWRLKHLDWVESTEKRLLLFTTPSSAPTLAAQP